MKPFSHRTKVALQPGNLVEPGYRSNYGQRKKACYGYLSATLDVVVWGTELAQGAGPGRIYVIEPTNPIEDDPNLTDKKFPGTPTRSYRSRSSLRVAGEVTQGQDHSPEKLQAMHDNLERLRQQEIEALED